jgi:MoxR-like ATPase
VSDERKRTGASGKEGPAAIARSFDEKGFLCDEEVPVVLHLSEALGKPVLLEGPPGVGKTQIAKLWAAHHGSELIRLQCYEGLDEAKALYEWSYGKQMLYAQLLKDKVGQILAGTETIEEAMGVLREEADRFFSRDFLLARPILQAITSERPVVLLVDEVDRADEPFEAFLLEVLSDFQVSVPELGTIRAERPPRVVLTSNDTRELSDALRRRCLYLYVEYPDAERELRIVERRVPGVGAELARRLVAFVQRARKAGLRKPPGISETVDWAAALASLGAETLDLPVLRKSLGALLKHREDLRQVLADPSKFR